MKLALRNDSLPAKELCLKYWKSNTINNIQFQEERFDLLDGLISDIFT